MKKTDRPIRYQMRSKRKTNNLKLNRYALLQNYPNPFNSTTIITFTVGTDNYTSLRIYDILGREIITLINEMKKAGLYSMKWNGRNSVGQAVGSGVYFYQLKGSSGFIKTQRMILLN